MFSFFDDFGDFYVMFSPKFIKLDRMLSSCYFGVFYFFQGTCVFFYSIHIDKIVEIYFLI